MHQVDQHLKSTQRKYCQSYNTVLKLSVRAIKSSSLVVLQLYLRHTIVGMTIMLFVFLEFQDSHGLDYMSDTLVVVLNIVDENILGWPLKIEGLSFGMTC